MISSAYAATPDAPGGAFPPFDSSTFVGQLFWLVIFFGALYWLMSKVALPRVASILEERKDRVARDLADAAAAKTKAEGAMTAYEKSLADARGKAHGVGHHVADGLLSRADRGGARVEFSRQPGDRHVEFGGALQTFRGCRGVLTGGAVAELEPAEDACDQQ